MALWQPLETAERHADCEERNDSFVLPGAAVGERPIPLPALHALLTGMEPRTPLSRSLPLHVVVTVLQFAVPEIMSTG